jgi:hypothetical protein
MLSLSVTSATTTTFTTSGTATATSRFHHDGGFLPFVKQHEGVLPFFKFAGGDAPRLVVSMLPNPLSSKAVFAKKQRQQKQGMSV